MANPEHVTLLRRGCGAVTKWRTENAARRVEDSHVRLDLTGADLTDIDLRGLDLRGAIMCGADLSQCDLRTVNLDADEILNSEGRRNIIGTDLTKASLSYCNIAGAILKWASFREANLRGANLRGAFLQLVDFTEAELTDTDLGWSMLSGAKLRNANLTDADLECANLSQHVIWADLSCICIGADLSGADLTNANLSHAQLENTVMTDVQLDKAQFEKVRLSGIDLSTVKGLDTIVHSGPSSIDVDTLTRSRGKIPDHFLRGCGITDNLITYLPSLTGHALEFYSCFISYSHEDKSFARRLHDALQGRGIRCWLDEKQMLPGDDIYDQVDRGIRLWDKILLCASEYSLTSWWVDNEIDAAFKKEQKLMKERGRKVLALIPLDLDGFLLSGQWKSGKAMQVTSRLAADFNGWKDNGDLFDRELERVVKALATDNSARESPPTTHLS